MTNKLTMLIAENREFALDKIACELSISDQTALLRKNPIWTLRSIWRYIIDDLKLIVRSISTIMIYFKTVVLLMWLPSNIEICL